MRNVFRADGHLHDQALRMLLRDEPLDELTRLEIAEHLSYCDHCLQRYSDLLADTALHTPQNSCRESLWHRVRLRTTGALIRRYAAAAAAVLLALTLLWGSTHPDFAKVKQTLSRPHTPYTETLQSRWNGVADHTASWLSDLVDLIDPLQERKDP